jgi:GNAT superfamily N-acetyltransferase
MSKGLTEQTGWVVRELTAEVDLRAVFPIVRALRPRLDEDGFLAHVRQQAAEGYVVAAGYVDGRPVTVAGYRVGSTLSRGPHLFVDDLVTDPAEQGKGYATALLDWLRAKARAAGVGRVYLDSRDSAVGYYEKRGFTFLTSRPCWIDSGEGETGDAGGR